MKSKKSFNFSSETRSIKQATVLKSVQCKYILVYPVLNIKFACLRKFPEYRRAISYYGIALRDFVETKVYLLLRSGFGIHFIITEVNYHILNIFVSYV